MRTRGAKRLVVSALLAFMLCSCETKSLPVSSGPPSEQVTGGPRTQSADPPSSTQSADPPSSTSPRGPKLVQDAKAQVPPDLQRLAEKFVMYAVGDSDSFPHSNSVSMSIGGQAVVSIDDIAAALSRRDIWKICPADWERYGASSCPVDLLGPINEAVVNGASLAYSSEYRDVTCAPTRSGPLPVGRLVVLRPSQARRSCASDFALALVGDEQGRLRSVDLTLSEP